MDRNLFDLGADSLQLIHIHNRLKESVSADVKVADMFAYPTINALAQHLGVQRPSAPGDPQDRGAARRALRARPQGRE